MKKLFAVLMLFLAVTALSFSQQNVSAPQKFALVIGNGNYTNTTKLNNPVNDANDMAAALQGLGFTVNKVLNGTQDQMVNAVMNLKRQLSASINSYGFLFYAGHGVQSNGENFLIPVDANIPSENFLRNRTVSVQEMLDEINDAGNEFNVVVLDACRDNPFSWKRSGNRGLSVVGHQPADSIIVYATAAGSTAADGTGRNGLFTSHLLNNLKTPGLEVRDVFRITMGDVARASGNQQRPAVYDQFSGLAYLGSRPVPAAAQPAPTPASVAQPTPAPAAVSQPAPAHVPTSVVVQPTPAPTASTGQTYKIGDKGPAGGVVFYDKGRFNNGWRYLEASPDDMGSVEWGSYEVNVSGTKTGIGEGKRNTELIIAELNKRGETGKAAQLCKVYTLNGYNDWFLPSKNELNEMYKARTHIGISSMWHWSSSQRDNYYALIQNFNDGYQDYNRKLHTYSVRAIRSF